MKIKTYRILVGLPGCGKTTYAEKNNDYYSEIVRMDNMTPLQMESKLAEISSIKNVSYRNFMVYIDGLIASNEDIIRILDLISLNPSDRIEIHRWEDDIEGCLVNDRYRREKCSTSTIKNMNILVDVDTIKEKSGIDNEICLIKHEFYRKNKYEVFATRFNLYLQNGLKVYSDKWSNGGTWRNYWGREGHIEPDKQPDFEEFDNILKQVCPTISYFDYKDIYNKCVDINEYVDEADYYGGYENISRYELDVKKLYDELLRRDLINEGDYV